MVSCYILLNNHRKKSGCRIRHARVIGDEEVSSRKKDIHEMIIKDIQRKITKLTC